MRVLRNRIVRGVYTGKLPGLRTLAAELGSNPKTVQLALVQLQAAGMVHRQERKGTFAIPAQETSLTTGLMYARLVVPPPGGSFTGHPVFWTSLAVHAFQKAARARGLSVALEYTDDLDHVVTEVLAEARFPGCVGTCLLGMPVETKYLVRLASAIGPMVVADWEIEDQLVPSVCFDNYAAGRMAARHLLELGHRRIAFVTDSLGTPNLKDRLRGVKDTLAEAGLELVYMLESKQHPRQNINDMFAMDPRPTACISGWGVHDTRSLKTVITEAGLRVPEDISIVRIGGQSSLLGQRMSVTLLDLAPLGERALEMLVQDDLHTNPEKVLIPPHFMDFGTTTRAVS